MNEIAMNRQYKDRLFKFVFKEKEELLSLYNALNNSNYTNIDDLQISTIEDFLFMGMKNDISFIIDNNLELYEQQSTFCPNMPMRGLLYIAKQFQGIIDARDDEFIYGEKLMKFPAPNMVVLYNGDDKNFSEDQAELKLSDCFVGKSDLEFKIKVYNINRGHNKTIMEKCGMLQDYSEFVSDTKKCIVKGKIDPELLDLTVKKFCREHPESKLSHILSKHRQEVRSMIFMEYDQEKEMAKAKKMYRNMGREEGREEGRVEGREEGRVEGRVEGREEGRVEGRVEGREETIREVSKSLLERGMPLGEVLKSLKISREEFDRLGIKVPQRGKIR